MSGEQFLRAHGWRARGEYWLHPRLPDMAHSFSVALQQTGEWLALELEDSKALWAYWRSHDISENDDRWAEFTNAVYAHLDHGAPVPDRFRARKGKPR